MKGIDGGWRMAESRLKPYCKTDALNDRGYLFSKSVLI